MATGDEDDDLDADGNPRPGPPPVAPEERRRRAHLIELPEHQTLLRNVLAKRIRSWFRGDKEALRDAVDHAIELAVKEATRDPSFPGADAEGELPKFFERIAERIGKREQRRFADEKRAHVSIDEHVVAAAPVEHIDYDEEEARRIRGLPGFVVLYQHHVLARSIEDIARERNTKASAIYAIMKRTKAQMSRAGAATVAMAMFAALFLYLRRREDPVAHHYPTVTDAGVAYDRAMMALHDGEKACNLGQWGECWEQLDKAAAADPTIQERDTYKELRAAADAHRPTNTIAPPEERIDDSKAPGPDGGKRDRKAPGK